MQYIVFDLEMNNKWGSSIHEIIEIGAVKIDGNLEIVGGYQSFIKPKIHIFISKMIRRKTKIRQEWVNKAPDLPYVLDGFKDWIGAEEYLLCGWGRDDLIAMERNFKMNEMNADEYDMLKNYRDIQKSFGNIFQLKNQISLKNALEMINVTPRYDIWHRAIFDAINTAQVFIEIYDKIDLGINDQKLLDTDLRRLTQIYTDKK
jgi:inhibitor of KinA sporulation pathway (predicted exonuclease)